MRQRVVEWVLSQYPNKEIADCMGFLSADYHIQPMQPIYPTLLQSLER